MFCRWDKPADFGDAGASAEAEAGWTEVRDEGSGRTYYYNATTVSATPFLYLVLQPNRAKNLCTSFIGLK